MFYLHRAGAPVPAEAPYISRVDEKYEWGYGHRKHQEALRSIKGQVDHSAPQSINPPAQRIQAHSRNFSENQRRAEIGRENRKLVDRLGAIARGTAGVDPRGPPPSSLLASVSAGSLGGSKNRPGGYGVPMQSSTSTNSMQMMERSKSLNGDFRRQNQRKIDLDNASLVRRILHAGPTLDRRKEDRDFIKHKRAVHNMQKMGGNTEKPRERRTLPPFRAPRPSSNVAPARGLDMLLLPSDLQRTAGGVPGSETGSCLGDQADGDGLGEATWTNNFSGQEFATLEGEREESRSPPPQLLEKKASRTYSDGFSPAGGHVTARRRWVAEDAANAEGDNAKEATKPHLLDSPVDEPIGDVAGMTRDSEIGFADTWDDFSMSGTSPLQAGSTSPFNTGFGESLKQSRRASGGAGDTAKSVPVTVTSLGLSETMRSTDSADFEMPTSPY
eukprot:TRINITY_DN74678_c0_g1_i1.p1 TRINITY_DN74678_c0_g1~~TRINITY_DN74678_c0_g1_i1.p1  ORF type:complete len:443 (+),score=75.87 TRINITY_DN74678_c0_g1_i1:64-1392(+)